MKHGKRVSKMIANHEKLIAIMEKLPKNKHDQSTWGDGYLKNEEDNPACGTKACALGWATLSGEIEGLWAKPLFDPEEDDKYFVLEPMQGKRSTSWSQAGIRHFGAITTTVVFMEGSRTKAGVIKALKVRLNALQSGEDNGNYP